MATYKELLLDPRWQKKRLKILERDDFACQYCGSTHLTLHVHHKIYIIDKKPWEYEDNILMTLCDDCHSDVHDGMDKAIDQLIIAVKSTGFMPKDIIGLANGLYTMPLLHAPEVIASMISHTCSDSDLQSFALSNFFNHLNEKIRAKEIH